MIKLSQIPKEEAVVLCRELTIQQIDIIIESLDKEIIKLKGIKLELLNLK